MKILLTSGGTGGHFYPIIAIAEELNRIIDEEKLVGVELIFMSTHPYNPALLAEKGIRFKKTSAGKIRRYFSFLNFTDIFKTGFGIVKSIGAIYFDFPDVVFGKGGYASFPALVAARFFRIPVIIHESDVVPGKVNFWASRFAKLIAVSFTESVNYFPKKTRNKIAVVGTPVRKDLIAPSVDGAYKFLDLESGVPTILILGGSQGSQKINDTVVDIAEQLVEKYQIIHQCGEKNINDVRKRISVVLENSAFKHRYHSFGQLNSLAMKMSAGAADFVVSRAGSSAIFEIAAWGKPSLIIPLSSSAQDHQKENAYAFAKSESTNVLEEKNLTSHILLAEINRSLSDSEMLKKAGARAKDFFKPDAAKKIARGIMDLALEHA